jgi:alcohol dehydrogenase class IV
MSGHGGPAGVDAGSFRWPDGERLIVFGRGSLESSGDLLGSGYALLTTPRAARSAPSVVAAAASVHEIPDGRVDELAAALRDLVSGELLVALGGGRVIDTAKALAAAGWAGTGRVAAIPTTLSGAEMTTVHMHATGVPPETARVRPALVINDPALCASQPLTSLAQSAANALGHAAEGPLTPMRGTVTTLAALEAARLIAAAFADAGPPPGALATAPGGADTAPRDQLALGALLAGYVIGSTWYGLHHVMSQTLRRVAGLGHGEANAIMLPHSIGALTRRDPEAMARLGDALGEDPATFARRLCGYGGISGLRAAGVGDAQLDRCVELAATRAELNFTPPAADAAELRALYEAAL